MDCDLTAYYSLQIQVAFTVRFSNDNRSETFLFSRRTKNKFCHIVQLFKDKACMVFWEGFFVLTSNNVLYVNIIWIHFRKHTGRLRKK